jgi:branched-chain amino acid transport system permease protein
MRGDGRSRATSRLGTLRTLGLLWGVTIMATVIGSLGNTTIDRAVVTGLITMVLVVGLSVFVGNSGVFSFGHMAFMAIGAYTTAILATSTQQKAIQLKDLPDSLASVHVNPVVAALVSGTVAALFALVLTLPLMRLSGLTASLASVAMLIIVRVVLQNADRFTRGTRGLIIDADKPSTLAILVWALLAIAAAFAFKQSRVGVRLASSREDEVAAKAVGIRVWWERGVAFVLSAFLVGVGGSVFAVYFGSINPDTFYLSITFTVVAMLVVGGLTSLSGAVIGTIVISTVLELLRQVEDGMTVGPLDIPARPGLAEVGLAVILLVILIVRPDGLTGGGEIRWPGRRRPVARLETSDEPDEPAMADDGRDPTVAPAMRRSE